MLIVSFLLLSLANSQSVPVWSGKLAPQGSVKGEYCNIAIVRSDRHLIVRAGPGRNFAKIGSVPRHATVYTCNESADRKVGYERFWVGIAYGDEDKPCIGAEKLGLPVQLTKQCATGWVERNSVQTLTG